MDLNQGLVDLVAVALVTALAPADVGITTAEAAATTDAPPDSPGQPTQFGRPEP